MLGFSKLDQSFHPHGFAWLQMMIHVIFLLACPSWRFWFYLLALFRHILFDTRGRLLLFRDQINIPYHPPGKLWFNNISIILAPDPDDHKFITIYTVPLFESFPTHSHPHPASIIMSWPGMKMIWSVLPVFTISVLLSKFSFCATQRFLVTLVWGVKGWKLISGMLIGREYVTKWRSQIFHVVLEQRTGHCVEINNHPTSPWYQVSRHCSTHLQYFCQTEI